LYNKVTVINTDPNKYFSEQLLTNLEKSKIPKTLFDFITNVNDKKKFVNDLKSNFKSEFGISFKILIELLKEEKIILQGDREFKKLYNAIKVNFNRDIGTYVSLNDYYKHSTDHKKSIKMILRL
jgi:hypothetical protein